MAQRLLPIPLRNLGKYGFFAEADGRYSSVEYASTFTNLVYDTKGRPAARKGWDAYLSSALTGTPSVVGLHHYVQELDGSNIWLAASDDGAGTYKIWSLSGDTGSGSATDITGAITSPSSANWQFANYNNKVVGIVQGDNPIEWDGTGSFADHDSGGSGRPDGNCIISAYGRLWATSADGQTLYWTPSLSDDWDGTGSGSLNVRLVWPSGTDSIVGLAAFSNRIIILGSKSILIYGDSAASTTDVGIDPNGDGFGLLEVVVGTGLYARDCLVEVGDDLMFLSKDGVRTLRRAVDYDNLPMQTVTRQVDPFLLDFLASQPAASTCKMVYHVDEALVLLRIGGSYFYFDVRQPIHTPEDADRSAPIFRASTWSGLPWLGAASGNDGNLRFGFAAGLIGEYAGYLDNTSTYTIDLSTVWLDLDDGEGRGERLKIPKRLLLFASTEQTYQVALRWAFDFSTTFFTRTVTVTQDATPAEWGLGEWGEDEWSGGSLGIFKGGVAAAGSGTFIKLGMSLAVDDAAFAYNTLTLQTKLGRLSR